jgi:hypothetical protein
VLLICFVIQSLRERDNRAPVPVRVEMAGYDPLARDLDSWLARRTAQYGISESISRILVKTGRILPVLDGFDEMGNYNELPHRQSMALERLDAYVAGTELGFVLACRELEWEHLTATIKSPVASSIVRIRKLDSEQIRGYITSQLDQASAVNADWSKVLARLRRGPGTLLADTLSRPLWLYLAVLVFRSNPGDLLASTEADDLRKRLLAGFVPAATKLLGPRPSRGRQYDEVEVSRWLRRIASFLEASQSSGPDTVDIVPEQLWQIAGLRRIRLLNLLLTGVMVGFLLLLGWASIREFYEGIASGTAPKGNPLGITFLFIGVGIFLVLDLMRGSAAKSVTPSFIGWRFRKVSLKIPSIRSVRLWIRRVLERSFVNGGLAKLMVLIIVTLAILIDQTQVTLTVSFVFKLLFAAAVLYVIVSCAQLVVNVLFAPVAALVDFKAPKPRRPYDTLRRDRVVGIMIVIAFAGLMMLSSFTSHSSPLTNFLDAVVFAGLFVTTVSRSTLRYALAVAIMAEKGELPVDLKSFLDWGVETGFLREAGAAYQFRHVEFQRWLVDSERGHVD